MGQKKAKRMMFCFCLIILCIISSFFVIKPIRASRNIYVDDSAVTGERDGSADHPYRTIQYAHDVAEDGDFIYVFEGTYNESLTITKQVSIVGLEKEKTIIAHEGASFRYLVEIKSSFVTLENLTLSDPGNDCLVALLYISADSVTLQSIIVSKSPVWGVYFASTNDHTVGGSFINTTKGVNLVSSNNNVFSNNNFSYCTQAAVQIASSSENIFYNNTFYKNNYGITIQSGNHNISKNTILSSTYDGIKITGSAQALIRENVIKNCNGNGISFSTSENIINGNELDHNQINLQVTGSNCQIVNNFINNSRIYGIYADSSSKNNIFSLNHFYKNAVQVKDFGKNQWYSEENGNYWDDYQDGDRDHDHIGDIPYYITSVIKDLYPRGIFLKPPLKPSRPSPSDGAENVGLFVTLEVTVYDNDSDDLDVFFYHATDDSFIGADYNIQNGKNASCSFRLPFETTYAWYAVVTDGKFENQSNIFIFITRQIPPTNEKPIANPGGPYTAAVGQQITFDGSQSTDPDGTIDFYRWNFGDGSSEILSIEPSHIYQDPGTYTFTLTVVDNNGRSNTATTTVTVLSSLVENKAPVPLIITTGTFIVQETIGFDASSSSDPDGSISNYSWNFGDGTSGNGITTTHVYSSAGTFTVILTVTDNEDLQQSISKTITIEPLKGFPGFEFIFMIAALCIALFIIYYRRK